MNDDRRSLQIDTLAQDVGGDQQVDAFLLAAASERADGQAYLLGSGVSTRFISISLNTSSTLVSMQW